MSVLPYKTKSLQSAKRTKSLQPRHKIKTHDQETRPTLGEATGGGAAGNTTRCTQSSPPAGSPAHLD